MNSFDKLLITTVVGWCIIGIIVFIFHCEEKTEIFDGNKKQNAFRLLWMGPVCWVCGAVYYFGCWMCNIDEWLGDAAASERDLNKAKEAAAEAKSEIDKRDERAAELLAEIERLQAEALNNIESPKPKRKAKRKSTK
jgi:hypothetical protein